MKLLAILTSVVAAGIAPVAYGEDAVKQSAGEPAAVHSKVSESFNKEPFAGFDQYVAKAMQEFDTPGLAVAIVKDDKVVFSKGYGVRKIGESASVDENTLFAIGSTSKAFTAALIGCLVDQGKMSWDGKVTDYLSWFQLYDPYVTREVTIRDLLTHRTGLRGERDWLWYASPLNREEIIRALRYEKPAWSFRSHWDYNNVGFLTAGECAASAGRDSWDHLVAKMLFEPMGMSSTCTSTHDLTALSNVASPHARVDGVIKALPYRCLDNVAPAGSINSTVKDMSQWVRLQLSGGKIGNKQLISEAALAEIHSPQMILPAMHVLTGRSFPAYGLGWGMVNNQGHKILSHQGGIDGMTALVELIPDAHTGYVILSNGNGSMAPQAIGMRLMDSYLNLPLEDGVTIAQGEQKESKAKDNKEYAEAQKNRVSGTHPTLAVDKYAGVYNDPEFGDITVACKEGKLTLSYGPYRVGTLKHWHYDTFEIEWNDPMLPPHRPVVFRVDCDGQPSQLDISELSIFNRVSKPEP